MKAAIPDCESLLGESMKAYGPSLVLCLVLVSAAPEAHAGRILRSLRSRRSEDRAQTVPVAGLTPEHAQPEVAAVAPGTPPPRVISERPTSSKSEAENAKEVFDKIVSLSEDISAELGKEPHIPPPFPIDIRQISPEYRKQALDDLRAHLSSVEILAKLVKEGTLKRGMLKEISLAVYAKGVEPLPSLSLGRRLEIAVPADEAKIRKMLAAIPSREKLDEMDEQIEVIRKRLNLQSKGIGVRPGGISHVEALRGMQTLERILGKVDLAPKAILHVSTGEQNGYNGFSKELAVKPGTTLEELKKFLETVPAAPTQAIFDDFDKLMKETKNPLIKAALTNAAPLNQSQLIEPIRERQHQATLLAEKLGVDEVFLPNNPEEAKALMEKLMALPDDRLKPNRAVKRLMFQGEKTSSLDCNAALVVKQNATPEEILAALNAAPDKETWKKISSNVTRRLDEAGRTLGRGGFISLDFNQVTPDEALAAAALVESVAASGYRLKEPAKGVYVVSASTGGWAGARYWDSRHQFVMVGANSTTLQDLVKGGFVEKKM